MSSISSRSIWLLGLVLASLTVYGLYAINRNLAALRTDIVQLEDSLAPSPQDNVGVDYRPDLLARIVEQNQLLIDTLRQVERRLAERQPNRASPQSAIFPSQTARDRSAKDLQSIPAPIRSTSTFAPDESPSPPPLAPATQGIIADVIDRHMQSARAQSPTEENPEKLLQLMQDTDAAIRDELYLLLTEEEFEAFYRPLQAPGGPFAPPAEWGETEP